MTAHIRVPALTGDDPATFSRRGAGRPAARRVRLHRRGHHRRAGDEGRRARPPAASAPAAVRALAAGADLLCIGAEVDARAGRGGRRRRSSPRSPTAGCRSPGSRRRSPAPPRWPPGPRRAARVAGAPTPSLGYAAARRAVRVEGSLAGLERAAGRPAGVAATRSPRAGCRGASRPHLNGTEQLERGGRRDVRRRRWPTAAGGRPIVVVGRHTHRLPAARALVERLAAAHPVAVVEMGWPSRLAAGRRPGLRHHVRRQPRQRPRRRRGARPRPLSRARRCPSCLSSHHLNTFKYCAYAAAQVEHVQERGGRMDLKVWMYLVYLAGQRRADRLGGDARCPATGWSSWRTSSPTSRLAKAVNQLLVVGFYLLNLGYVTVAMRSGGGIDDASEALETLSMKIGLVLLVLGVAALLQRLRARPVPARPAAPAAARARRCRRPAGCPCRRSAQPPPPQAPPAGPVHRPDDRRPRPPIRPGTGPAGVAAGQLHRALRRGLPALPGGPPLAGEPRPARTAGVRPGRVGRGPAALPRPRPRPRRCATSRWSADDGDGLRRRRRLARLPVGAGRLPRDGRAARLEPRLLPAARRVIAAAAAVRSRTRKDGYGDGCDDR